MERPTAPYVQIFKAGYKGRTMAEMLDRFLGPGNWVFGETSHGASRGVHVRDEDAVVKLKMLGDDIHSIGKLPFDWPAYDKRRRLQTEGTGASSRRIVLRFFLGDGEKRSNRVINDMADWYHQILRVRLRELLAGKLRVAKAAEGAWRIDTDDPQALAKLKADRNHYRIIG